MTDSLDAKGRRIRLDVLAEEKADLDRLAAQGGLTLNEIARVAIQRGLTVVSESQTGRRKLIDREDFRRRALELQAMYRIFSQEAVTLRRRLRALEQRSSAARAQLPALQQRLAEVRRSKDGE